MADPLALPPALSGASHLLALAEAVDHRFAELDPSAFLMWADVCPSAALLWLARDSDLMGYRGWALAASEEAQRELIRSAFELHRLAGTKAGLRRAIEAIGFGGVTIETAPAGTLDGTWFLDGTYTLSGSHWATFRVDLDLGASPQPIVSSPSAGAPGVTSTADLVGVIHAWKRQAATLMELSLSVGVEEFAAPTEALPSWEIDQDTAPVSEASAPSDADATSDLDAEWEEPYPVAPPDLRGLRSLDGTWLLDGTGPLVGYGDGVGELLREYLGGSVVVEAW